MSAQLSAVPTRSRRQLAGMLAVFAALFVAVGAVAVTGSGLAVLVLGGVALAVGVLLALLAWGVVVSLRNDRADRSLDAAIEEAMAASGKSAYGCGHDHDPAELHVTDDPCAADGAGTDCTHTCDTCVLSRLR